MTRTKLEWKVSGLLPIPVPDPCKYFLRHHDAGYSNRVLGRSDIEVKTYTLTPTKLFHQLVDAENLLENNVATKSFPYQMPLDGTRLPVSIQIRVFFDQVMVVTLKVIPDLEKSYGELIELSLFSNHPSLEALVQTIFNAHFCPKPSQMLVEGRQSKPLLRVFDQDASIQQLIDLVSRHPGMNERAVAEMLAKNSDLNFNDDLMLIDRQGLVFNCLSSDTAGQNNRFRRVEPLFEFAMALSTFITSNRDGVVLMESEGDLEWRNAYLRLMERDVVPQSVSAKRAWQTISTEFDLDYLDANRVSAGELADVDLQAAKKHWHERPVGLIFIGVVIAILSAILVSVLGLN